MNANFIRLDSNERLTQLFEESHEKPVILFKHSTTCPISSGVYQEISRVTGDINLVIVQTARPISNAIAERTGIRHESPQAIVLKNGEAVYHASHFDVTAEDVLRNLESWALSLKSNFFDFGFITLKNMIEPTQIIEENDHEITISWSDDAETSYRAVQLRRACPCAGCVNEWTGEKMLKDENIDENISFLHTSVVGRYALNFHFSDGHDTGIFTFQYLRKLAE